MNICIISPNPNIKDGIARYSAYLANAIRKQDQRVLLLTTKEGGKSSNIHEPLLSFYPRDILTSYRAILKFEPDIIHIQHAIPAYGLNLLGIWILIIRFKLINKKKIIITLHEIKREIDLLGIISKIYIYLICQFSNLIIVHTSQAVEVLTQECFVDPKKIRRISHFVFPNKSKSPIHMRDQKKQISIMFFGYIHPDKGLEYLIEAIRILESIINKQSIKCYIAGDIRPRSGVFKLFEEKDKLYKIKLLNLIRSYHLENKVVFLGYIPENNKTELFNTASIFVLPYTKSEQSGVLYTLLPYMKPIIATDINGFKETLERTNLLIKPANAVALADKIKTLIHEKGLSSQAIKQYTSILKNDSLNNVARRILKAYLNT